MCERYNALIKNCAFTAEDHYYRACDEQDFVSQRLMSYAGIVNQQFK